MRYGVRAGLFGLAAAMRSMTPLAGLALRSDSTRGVKPLFSALAIGEWIFDKLPFAGDRRVPISLLVRTGVGALAGLVVAPSGRARSVFSVVVGLTTALGGTFLFHRVRELAAERVPPTSAAIGEDLMAAALTALALQGSFVVEETVEHVHDEDAVASPRV